MSVKGFLGRVLPPTNRNFEERVSELGSRLGQALSDNHELKSQVAHLQERLDLVLDELSRAGGRLVETSDKVSFVERRQRFVNTEYLSLPPDAGGRILVAGWYGADNFGDELMLRTVIESFSREALDRVCVLLWDNPRYDRWQLDLAVHVIHYPNSIWDLEILSERFDTLVWGGGAIIDDKQFTADPDNFNTGNLLIRLSELMLARGKRVYALGLSANDRLENERYIERLSAIIDSCDLFSIRDPYSTEVLARAGVDVGKIVQCEDLAFCNSDLMRLRDAHEPVLEKRLGVVLLSVEDSFEHYVRVLGSLAANERLRDEGYTIALIPFLDENKLDETYFARLLECVSDADRVVVEEYAPDLLDTPIARCSALVSYKYHASLIADVLGIPNICVFSDSHPHYRNKMTHLAELASTSGALYSSSSFEEGCSEAIEALLSSSDLPYVETEMILEQRQWLGRVCQEISGLL